MNHLVDLQIQRNTATRDYWDVYTPHRQEIAKHLIHSVDCGTTRLCVLGAGNCNDLDLKRLTTSFREIHLIDLDGQALRAGVARQKVNGYSAVYLHEDIDVTGVFHFLVNWTAVLLSTLQQKSFQLLKLRIVQSSLKWRHMSPGNQGVFQLLKEVTFQEFWHSATCEKGAILGCLVNKKVEKYAKNLQDLLDVPSALLFYERN